MKDRKELTLLEIENLMMETLAYEGTDLNIDGHNFKGHDYQGTQGDLVKLMEALAIKKDLVEKVIEVSRFAWAGSSMLLHPGSTTNFSRDQIKKIYEAFYILLNRGIIAPGAVGNYGPNLPNFHVTDYGLECIKQIDILPYDIEGYLKALDQVPNLDEWIKFYIQQSVECFNTYCYEASLIMVGLANEVIMNNLIESYLGYLGRNCKTEEIKLKKDLDTANAISTRYLKYRSSVKERIKSDKDLGKLSKYLDELAGQTFMSYVRLTRNELAHPGDIKTDRITNLMILISFVKFCEKQYFFINYYNSK